MEEESKSELTGEDLRRHRQAMVEIGHTLPGTGFEVFGTRAVAWPEDLRDTPLILDTDIGGDADDAFAVTVAARHERQLVLVLTADETRLPVGKGQRARFARWLLDSLGRTDVATVAGQALGDTRYFTVGGMTPPDIPAQPEGSAAIIDAVAAVCARTTGPVRWVGMAPLTNLAHLVDHAPDLARRLRVTQMAGGLPYHVPDRAEHNIRLDIEAAHRVWAAVRDGRLATPEFVTSDVTFTPEIAIKAEHPIHLSLAKDPQAWAQILLAHLKRCYTTAYPSTVQHDPLALSAALELPFVTSGLSSIALDDNGCMTIDDQTGVPVRVSRHADYPAFMTWLTRAVDPAIPATALAGGPVRSSTDQAR